jgi:hypothetical protein
MISMRKIMISVIQFLMIFSWHLIKKCGQIDIIFLYIINVLFLITYTTIFKLKCLFYYIISEIKHAIFLNFFINSRSKLGFFLYCLSFFECFKFSFHI